MEHETDREARARLAKSLVSALLAARPETMSDIEVLFTVKLDLEDALRIVDARISYLEEEEQQR